MYGAADGLLLSPFPILRVFAALRDTRLRRRTGGVVAVGAIAMAASLAMTAVCHAGYSDFRSDKMRKTASGDLVWSVPTLPTLNPIGAPVAHVSLHVGAVVHNQTPICSSRLTEARKQARPATNNPSRVAG